MKEQITIIIVDDHQIVRAGLRYGLSQLPDFIILEECADGESAVSQVLKLKPNVVLMDIALPGIDGIEATRQIKEAQPEIHVLMLTDHDIDDDVFAAFSAGADGYCVKDTSPENIAIAVRAIDGGACWLDPQIAKRILSDTQSKNSPSSSAVSGQAVKFDLTERELNTLVLLVEGLTNQEIATRSHVSAATVKSSIRQILRKLSVSDRTQAAVKAYREGIINRA